MNAVTYGSTYYIFLADKQDCDISVPRSYLYSISCGWVQFDLYPSFNDISSFSFSITTGARHSKARFTPHCRMLQPVQFNAWFNSHCLYILLWKFHSVTVFPRYLPKRHTGWAKKPDCFWLWITFSVHDIRQCALYQTVAFFVLNNMLQDLLIQLTQTG